MKQALTVAILFLLSVPACMGEDAVTTSPGLTGSMVTRQNPNQCQPVDVNFTLTNSTDATLYSERPYTGSGYNMYQSFTDSGRQPQKDRYMVGVSIKGGSDGYPYRWGFRGALLPGKSTTIDGYLTIVQTDTYTITAALLKGGVPVGAPLDLGKLAITQCEYVPPAPETQIIPVPPIFAIVNGQYVYPSMTPYVIDGYTYVQARPFMDSLGGGVYMSGDSFVVYGPGFELQLTPGSQYALYNGVPVSMPAPVYTFNGVNWVAPRPIMSLMGGTVYFDVYSRQFFINTPWGQ